MFKINATCAGVIAASLLTANLAEAAGDCAMGKTLKDGVLTIATGNPAYFPWVLNDNPEGGEGFEAAVAYAVAAQMGFDASEVTWVDASFDQSIQPGQKNFDFNLQQFSITAERDRIVDFSVPYYTSAMAVVVRQPTIDRGGSATHASLKNLVWGADANTTALPLIQGLIAPATAPLLYDDNTDVLEAMRANQIDAALFDLPTALYLAAVVLDDGAVLGQFPANRSESPDQLGLLMEEGNPIKTCVDAALNAMKNNGELAMIEATWLQQATGVPLIR